MELRGSLEDYIRRKVTHHFLCSGTIFIFTCVPSSGPKIKGLDYMMLCYVISDNSNNEGSNVKMYCIYKEFFFIVH